MKKETSTGTDKLYYRIGEVSRILGVECHVLRFWEKNFPLIKAFRSSGRVRLYSRRDLDVFTKIKSLLQDERYTVEGARKKLDTFSFCESETLFCPPEKSLPVEKELLTRVRQELLELRKLLLRPKQAERLSDINDE